MATKEKTFIELDLVKIYPEIKSVDFILLKIPDGEYTSKLGYNNADYIEGKTTLRLEKTKP